MRIAIIGAGFCGMAAAWYLSRHPSIDIEVFDPKDIATGTSGIAAGLLHPYAGVHARLNWRAMEGMEATCGLLDAAAAALNRPVSSHKGMLRLAITKEQLSDFSLCAHDNKDVQWHSAEECHQMVSNIIPHPGIFIPSAIIVDCPAYLNGLWADCSKRNVSFNQTLVKSLSDLDDFDIIIVAMGGGTNTLPELAHLPLRLTKGQLLEFNWPNGVAPLPFPLNSHAYMIMHPNNQTCFVGATFEKNFHDLEPDVEVAKADILPKVREFFPLIDSMTLVGCRAGVRAGTPSRKPLVMRVNDKCWVLAGMGSKGLLYHALHAKELSEAILKG